ncbi:MAG: hypothetical protein MUE72_10665, partial [Chitinophagaceae bacterium]|nr:hypothetical protein [Chitinophagaceae bacterium]
TIVGRTEANFNDQRYLVDSTLFFYKNEFLDSAIVYRYKRNFLPIKTLENYTQPIGILFMAQFGTTTINDTIHLNFQNDQNKITLQKSDKIITVIGPESNTQLDLFQFTFEYDKQNRLVVIQPNNQTLQYNNLDNVEMDCLYNMCTHYWKYDNNINPFKAINDKLGIPYFIEGLSRNNPLFYIRTSKNEIPVKLNNFYQYDAKGRPVLINDKITIKYKDA